MSSEIPAALRIGTRGSPLALAQAYEVRRRLAETSEIPEADIAIVVIRTTGDQILDRALSEAGGKGLFTTEIEAALSRGEIDLAVHSAKDMPTVLPDGLVLAAYLPREDVRDAWFSDVAETIDALPQGATVGTASLRRGALVKQRRPDVSVVTFRGTVETRLEKLKRGDVDATLLAVAGLNRLGLTHLARSVIPIEGFLPALGQGAITIEARENDANTLRLLSALNDTATHQQLDCERAFLKVLDGSCRTPIAGYATILADEIRLNASVLKPDGSLCEDIEVTGDRLKAADLGHSAGHQMLDRLGGDLAAWLAS